MPSRNNKLQETKKRVYIGLILAQEIWGSNDGEENNPAGFIVLLCIQSDIPCFGLYTVPGWLYFTSTVYLSDYVKPTSPGNYTVKLDEAFCRIRVDGSGFEVIHRKPGAVSLTQTIFY